MDWLETTLQRLGAWLSLLLDPVATGLDRLGMAIHQQLDFAGVPFAWHSTIITLLWVLVVAMVVRSLSGWLRLLAVLLTALVLAKVYLILPGI